MTTYEKVRDILAEIDGVFARIDEREVDALCDAILSARRIALFGLGREGLAMRSFAMRLFHLGFNSAVVFDMTTPPIGAGDLFLVACGPGHLPTTEALIDVARKAGATILVLTAQPDGPAPRMADLRVTIPAQTMAEAEGSTSKQAMGSAFEQSLWILFDALVPRLQAATGQTLDDVRARHTNLE
ncbi:MAG: SIS domain-containing protein [Anaerolineae bacterium]|jgi:6-phospho-3-hexuloisomerase|nr:SIS domain-containing protein [Anaerolineae bacterium]